MKKLLLAGLLLPSFLFAATPVITLNAKGTQNAAFNYQITAANVPTSFNATGLPAGLGVNTSTGLISGTPTVSGSFTVTISATNSSGTGSSSLALTISPPAPVIASSLTLAVVQNTPISYQIVASNSPTSYSAIGLPVGLSINTSTGAIFGTPSMALGQFSITLGATNASGTGTAVLVLTINPPAATYVISWAANQANAIQTPAGTSNWVLGTITGSTSFPGLTGDITLRWPIGAVQPLTIGHSYTLTLQ